MTEEERLTSARLVWPEMAAQEADASTRMVEAFWRGEREACTRAMAEWVDARVTMIVYYEALPKA